jgi:hypothetical protein
VLLCRASPTRLGPAGPHPQDCASRTQLDLHRTVPRAGSANGSPPPSREPYRLRPALACLTRVRQFRLFNAGRQPPTRVSRRPSKAVRAETRLLAPTTRTVLNRQRTKSHWIGCARPQPILCLCIPVRVVRHPNILRKFSSATPAPDRLGSSQRHPSRPRLQDTARHGPPFRARSSASPSAGVRPWFHSHDKLHVL